MQNKKVLTSICLAALALLAGCGDDDSSSSVVPVSQTSSVAANSSSAASESSSSSESSEVTEKADEPDEPDLPDETDVIIEKPAIVTLTPDYSIDSINPQHTLQKLDDGIIFTYNKEDAGSYTIYQNNESISEYRFTESYAPDLLIGDLYFSLAGIYADGIMTVELNVYNLSTNSSKTVYSDAIANYETFIYQLNDSEIMFSYNSLTEGVRCETVVVYDFVADQYQIILTHNEQDWGNLSDTTQEISAVFGQDNLIYLLKEQRINNETCYYLTCIDKTGGLLYEHELEYLKKYTRTNCHVNYLKVFNNYVFVDFYNPSDIRKTFSVAVQQGNTYQEVALNINIYPAQAVTANLINDRYLLCMPFPDDLDYGRSLNYSANLFVFDITTSDFSLFKYEVENTDGGTDLYTHADTNGDLIISYMDYETLTRNYYFIAADQWCNIDE